MTSHMSPRRHHFSYPPRLKTGQVLPSRRFGNNRPLWRQARPAKGSSRPDLIRAPKRWRLRLTTWGQVLDARVKPARDAERALPNPGDRGGITISEDEVRANPNARHPRSRRRSLAELGVRRHCSAGFGVNLSEIQNSCYSTHGQSHRRRMGRGGCGNLTDAHRQPVAPKSASGIAEDQLFDMSTRRLTKLDKT